MNKWCLVTLLLCHLAMFPNYSTPFKIISGVLCVGMLIVLILSILDEKKKVHENSEEPEKIIDMRNQN